MKPKEVDVAVIGSGIGGLCAAAIMARAGYKTLVVEKLPRIGGRFSTIDYKGYKIHTGGIGAEVGTAFEQTLKEVGVKLEIRPVTDKLVYRIKGKDYQLPPKGGLKKLLTLCGKEEDAANVMTALRRALSWQEPSSKTTVQEWLYQYTRDEGLHSLFQTMVSGGNGLNIDQASAADFIYFLKVAGGWRNYGVLPDGPLAVTGRLAEVVQANGGEVWTRCRAKRIVVERERVKGMVVEKDGRQIEISAQAIINNAGPRSTIALAGAENFDRGYLREIRENVVPVPYLEVYTTSDRPLMDAGVLIPVNTRRVFCAICSTNVCPSHAPPGRHLLQSFSIPGSGPGPVNYKKELDLHVEDLKDVFPDFKKHGEILMASTFSGEWPVMRNLPGYSIPMKTPIELLYNVSDCLGRRGNIAAPGAVESAKLAAEDLLKRIKPM